jgi:hypothetical protein
MMNISPFVSPTNNTIFSPFTLAMSVNYDSFNVEVLSNVDDVPEDASILVTYKSVRRNTATVYALIVALVLCLLTIAVMMLAIDTYIRRREILPPTSAFCACVMFHNVMPNVPPAGVWIDFRGIFSNSA